MNVQKNTPATTGVPPIPQPSSNPSQLLLPSSQTSTTCCSQLWKDQKVVIITLGTGATVFGSALGISYKLGGLKAFDICVLVEMALLLVCAVVLKILWGHPPSPTEAEEII